MNLEEVSNNYKSLKSKVENCKKAYEKLNGLVKNQKALIDIQYGKMLIARGEGKEQEMNAAKEELEKLNKRMKEIEEKAKKLKESIEKSKTEMEDKLQTIKEDPEIGPQINKALRARYERQVDKLNKEKSEVVGKKAGLLIFKDLVADHPNLSNNLKEILYSARDIKEINNKIEENQYVENGVLKFKDANVQQQLQQQLTQADDKLRKNSQLLFDYCDKKQINKEEVKNYISLLVDNGMVEKQSGEINIEATFNKNTVKLDKEINRYDKRISEYSLLIENQKSLGNTQNGDKIKWWQFGKKFKNWMEIRKRKKLPQQSAQTTQSKKEEKEERKSFNKNLKYDIVREAMDQQQKEDLRNAKQLRNQNRDEADRDR